MIMNSYCHQASIKSIVNGPTLDYSTKCIIENLIARHWFCMALFFFFYGSWPYLWHALFVSI